MLRWKAAGQLGYPISLRAAAISVRMAGSSMAAGILYSSPSARLHGAHGRHGARIDAAHAVAMGYLEEAVPGGQRTDLQRLEKNVIAWIAGHSFLPFQGQNALNSVNRPGSIPGRRAIGWLQRGYSFLGAGTVV